MEAEVRAILEDKLAPSAPSSGLGSRIRARFAAVEDGELTQSPRQDLPRAADFDV